MTVPSDTTVAQAGNAKRAAWNAWRPTAIAVGTHVRGCERCQGKKSCREYDYFNGVERGAWDAYQQAAAEAPR